MASQRVPDVQSREFLIRGVPHKWGVLRDPTTHSESITNTGSSDYLVTTGLQRRSVMIVNGATNSVTFTVEGTPDHTGAAGWVTLATRADSSAAYSKTGVAVAGSATQVLFVSPDDLIACIRVNQSIANANGTTYTVHAEAAGPC